MTQVKTQPNHQPPKERPSSLRVWFSRTDIVANIASALNGVMDAETFISQMLISLSREDLINCTEQSKYAAVHFCALLGLLPSWQHVALIPRKVKIKEGGRYIETGEVVVDVMPQWQGYQALMLRHPLVQDVNAELVHVADAFKLIRSKSGAKFIEHEYLPFNRNRTFSQVGDLQGGFLEVIYADGRPNKYHLLAAEEIEKAKDCAQTDAIWKKWFSQMAYKTIYRSAYARRVVPIDPVLNERLAKLVAADDGILENDPLRPLAVAAQQQLSGPAPAPGSTSQSRVMQLAQSLAPATQPNQQQLVQQPAPPLVAPAAQPAPEAATENAAPTPTDPEPTPESQPDAPPAVADYLMDYASNIHEAKSPEEVAAAFDLLLQTMPQLADGDHEDANDLRAWKLAQLGRQPKPATEPARAAKGELFERGQQYE